MNNPIIYLIASLFISINSYSQTRAIIFSEDGSSFYTSEINDTIKKDRYNNSFSFDITGSIDSAYIYIKHTGGITLHKKLRLSENKLNIYAFVKTGISYNLRYRGSYNWDDDMPNFNIEDDSLFIPPLEVVDMNNISDLEKRVINTDSIIKSINIEKLDEKERTLFITKELEGKSYYCKEIKTILKEVNTEYSKMYILKSTIKNCIDPKNIRRLESIFKSTIYIHEFDELCVAIKQ